MGQVSPEPGSRAFTTAASAVWSPDESVRARSRLLAASAGWGFDSLEAMHASSIADPETFWRRVVDDLDIEFETPFTSVVDEGRGFEFPRWFVDGSINAAQLCSLRHAAGPLADKDAVVFEGDNGTRRALTFSQLDVEVRRFAANLKQLGVTRGDRVVLFLPVVPEAVVAYLACAMIGAISVPAFTGYAAEALASRMRDSEAVLLVTADGTTRRGKDIAMWSIAEEALAASPTVRRAVVVRHAGSVDLPPDGRSIFWDDLDPEPHPVEVVTTGANDPLTIIYTSGTTGPPKGIVHSHAGFLVKSAVDFAYGFDVHEDDVIAWIADMGWMLGPLLIMGGLQLGATIVLTEGVPTFPTTDRLWHVAERNGVTIQGIAPTAARAIRTSHDGSPVVPDSIRSFASTGEAWDEPTWYWLFNEVGRQKRPIINYSGGTETGGGILISYPFLPTDPASFNGPLPGMDVGVLDSSGSTLEGEVGELVVRNTWPGMTHAFWRDDDRYLKTYWSRWEHTWVHGDLASVSAHGTWKIHGRSDDTIKVSGRRVGPAELEAALLKDTRISETAVIGVPDEQRGQRVVAFVVLRDGVGHAHDLSEVAAQAVLNVGRSFAPSVIAVSSLPKTKNGKIMRRTIRARHLGEPMGDLTALDTTTPIEDIPTQEKAGASR